MILARRLHQPAGFDRRGLRPDFTSRYEVVAREVATDTVLATAAPDASSALVTGADGSDRRVYVRVVNAAGLADRDPALFDLRRVAFDGDGQLILPVPLAPAQLQLVALAGGRVEARFRGRSRRRLPAPATFRVYVATGGDAIGYGMPTLTLAGGARALTADLGAFAHGTAVRAVVRAVSSAGAEEQNTEEAAATADAQAPAAVTSLGVEVTPG
ncbi:MAG: hypothetical protein AAF612_12100 [Planctomycetota bacterium]